MRRLLTFRRFIFLATVFISSACNAAFSVDAPSSDALSADFRAKIVDDWRRQEATFGREFGSRESLDALKTRAADLHDYHDAEEATTPAHRARLVAAHDAAEQLPSDADAASTLTACETLRWAVRDAALANPLVAGKKLLFVKKNRFVCQMLHEYLGYYYEYGGLSGGGLFVLENPGFSDATRELGAGKLPRGVYQTPSLSFDGKTVYFSFADLSQVQPEDAPLRTSRDLAGLGLWERFHEEYENREDGKFHLFALDLETETPRQLTFGPFDDFSPLPLPDGSLGFVSTRRGGFARCNSHWEPLQTHTLHQLMKDGKTIRRLSYHETDEWNPSLTPDGRIVYTRWDYVDRDAAKHHGLWLTNPDGTNATSLFGNYTYEVNACYQARAIPGSNKYVFIIGGHHWVIGGGLALLDPSRLQYDAQTAEDSLAPIENLSPEIAWAESPDECPKSYYYAPYPLSEDVYLTSYSAEPLGGMASPDHPTDAGKLGLYYRDRFGNLELLFDDPNFSCLCPIPLEATEAPAPFPTALPPSAFEPRGEFGTQNEPSAGLKTGPWAELWDAPALDETPIDAASQNDAQTSLDAASQNDAQTPLDAASQNNGKTTLDAASPNDGAPSEPFGTFFLADVYESLAPLPEGRKIVELRVFQLLPKYPDFPGNTPRLGHAYAENARLYLGSVPVETDGSAHFKAPSRKPLYFQAVDETGRAVQTMRSEVYLQDGESRGCVGCHEQAGYTGQNVETQSLALGRSASEIAPGPRDARPFAFPRLIQPILDRACVSCHRDADATNENATTSNDVPAVAPDLTGAVEGEFTRSYDALKPYLRWYEWGGASIQQVATLPGRCGADESPLTAILDDENHRDLPNFVDADRRTLYLWLDANVPFYGVYDRRERQKILNGERVAPPRLQ
ncbi:MAG: hypothetical protein IJO06_13525 [Thermoguttaceae bacterium]|nr:hypothetical protein [Thermoguttaceae bacterium]